MAPAPHAGAAGDEHRDQCRPAPEGRPPRSAVPSARVLPDAATRATTAPTGVATTADRDAPTSRDGRLACRTTAKLASTGLTATRVAATTHPWRRIRAPAAGRTTGA